MEVIISVSAKIAEYTVAPIGRQFGYIIYYKRNLGRMKTDIQKLEGTKESVQHTVDEAKRNGEVIENIVQNWLNKVDNTVIEVKKIIDSEGHAKAQCSMGHFLNLYTRHQLSRKTKKMSQEISEVLAEGKFDKISYRAASHVTITPLGRGYEAVASRTSMLNEIMLALKNPDIFIIGVYGMGGVGKTTLVKELAWQAENDGSFSVVAMATITDSPDVEKIQGQIADALDMKFNKESKEGRAMQLRERITEEKSILVTLDDIWGELDLAEVGIPFGDHKGCKLVVTSRDLNVLNKMGIQKEFRLDVLHEDDSWKLFEKMAGDVVQELNIKPIAVEVVRCCSGLPLLIVTVAKALRKKHVCGWKDALNELKRFDQEGLRKKINSTLELSYNCLETEELKLLFLFIGSFEPDLLEIEELFTCYWGLGLYKHVGTLKDARNKYYNLIDDLRASSLLLESKTDLVRMHDVVKDVAKSIASRTRTTYGMQRFTPIKEWPKIDLLQKCHQITLPASYINELPEKLEFPKLELLILHNIEGYLEVPEDFFSGMSELKVILLHHGMTLTPSPPSSLHLVKKIQTLRPQMTPVPSPPTSLPLVTKKRTLRTQMTRIPSPPASLRLLTKIRSLSLIEGILEDISIVSELKSLEILSLEKSFIEELPKEIGQLTNLRMLNLSNCKRLRFIPANVISSLTCLEELYMENCFDQWDVKGSKDQSNNASLEELRNLSHLTTLEIMIQDASVLPRDLRVFENLERYNIVVGHISRLRSLRRPLGWSGGASPESSRTLALYECGSLNILDQGIKFLLNSAENMSLAGLECGRDVLYELNKEGFLQLKHLFIQDNTEMKYIINSMGWVHTYPALPNLETLSLRCMSNLEEICHGHIPKLEKLDVFDCSRLKNIVPSSMLFENLNELDVCGCDGLENIMKSSTATSLQKLRKLIIKSCEKIEEIVGSDDENDVSEVAFMKLEFLELSNLPKLRSFCKGGHGFNFPLLENVVLVNCRMMETFSHGVLNAPKLRAEDFKPKNELHRNVLPQF